MFSPTRWLRRFVPIPFLQKLHACWYRLRAPLHPEPYRTLLPYTMVSVKRLRALDMLAHRVDDLGILGDVVECGTCNGGSAAVMARIACQSPHDRHSWLLDSF